MGQFCKDKPNNHRLWDELTNVLGKRNRTLVKYWYNVAHNQEFLDLAQKDLEILPDGEPSLASLFKAANSSEYEEQIKKTLYNEIGGGEMEYQEAINKLQSFNRTTQFSENYMATITPSSAGKVFLTIVKKTPSEQSALKKLINSRSLHDQLIYQLVQRGVNVEFLETTDFNGRYSTFNAEQTELGLTTLIKIANGATNIEATLAEEAGHFAVGSLSKSPLVQRLENLLSNIEVIKAVYGEEFANKNLGKNPKKETAGYLVGQALINKADNMTAWGKLAYRISNIAKQIFATVTYNDVLKAKIEAEKIANNIASSFMSEEFQGSAESALETVEIFYDKKLTDTQKIFNSINNELEKLRKQLRAISPKSAGEVTDLLIELHSGQSFSGITFDEEVMQGMARVMISLSNQAYDMLQKFDTINTDLRDTLQFQEHFHENTQKIREIADYCKAIDIISKMILNATAPIQNRSKSSLIMSPDSEHVSLVTGANVLTTVNLRELAMTLQSFVHGNNPHTTIYDIYGQIQGEEAVDKGLADLCKDIGADYFTKFCEDILGHNYVIRASRMLFKDFKLISTKKRRQTIKELTTSVEETGGIFSHWFGSLATSNDVISQIVFKAYKAAKKQSHSETNLIWDDLRRLNQYMHSIKDVNGNTIKDSRMFYEVDDNGNLTGNIVSMYKQWKYDRDFQIMKHNAVQDFKEMHPELINDVEFGIQFQNYFEPLRKDFFKKTHHKDMFTGKWVPNNEYLSEQYAREILGLNTDDPTWQAQTRIRTSPGQPLNARQEFLSRYQQIKDSLDAKLPLGSTTSYRAPQFRGSFSDRAENRGGWLHGGHTRAFIDKLVYEVSIDIQGGDLGSDMTYTNEEDQLLANPESLFDETINRLPLYGINSLNQKTEKKILEISYQIHKAENEISDLIVNSGDPRKITELKESLKELRKKKADLEKNAGNNNLSTDIFRSTLAYANMANNYQALEQVVHIMEIGKDVLGNRAIQTREYHGKKKKNWFQDRVSEEENSNLTGNSINTIEKLLTGNKDYFYSSYTKFLDKQVYGRPAHSKLLEQIGVVKPALIIGKIFGKFTGITSIMYLGGSLTVSGLNIIDGIFEIIKVANAGIKINKGQIAHAVATFYKYMLPNWCSFFGRRFTHTSFRDDTISLVLRQFDITHKNESNYRSWDTKSIIRGEETLNNLLYLPMRMGEVFMTVVPYIAVLQNTYVYKVDGTKISVWDAYIEENSDHNAFLGLTQNTTRSFELKGEYFIDKKSRQISQNLTNAADYLRNLLNSTTMLTDAEFDNVVSQDYDNIVDVLSETSYGGISAKEHLNHLGVEIYDGAGKIALHRSEVLTLLRALDRAQYDLHYSRDTEASLEESCSLITNYMHGVYDSDHKGAFASCVETQAWACMKGYMFGMIGRRFSSNRYNIFDEKMKVDKYGNPVMYTEGLDDEQLGYLQGYIKYLDAIPQVKDPNKAGYIDNPDPDEIYLHREFDPDSKRFTYVEYRYQIVQDPQNPNSLIQTMVKNTDRVWDQDIDGEFSGSITDSLKVLWGLLFGNIKRKVNITGALLASLMPTNRFGAAKAGETALGNAGYSINQFSSMKHYVSDWLMYSILGMAITALTTLGSIGDDDEDGIYTPRSLTEEEREQLYKLLMENSEYRTLAERKENNEKLFTSQEEQQMIIIENKYRLSLNLPPISVVPTGLDKGNPWKHVHASDFKYDVSTYVKHYKELWDQGLTPDTNPFTALLGDPKLQKNPTAYNTIAKLEQLYSRQINRYYGDHSINWPMVAVYYLTRAQRDGAAFIDLCGIWDSESVTRQELTSNASLISSTIGIGGITTLAQLSNQLYGGMMYGDVYQQRTDLMKTLVDLEYSNKEIARKSKKLKVKDVPTAKSMFESILNYYKFTDTLPKYAENYKELFNFMIENELTTVEEVDKYLKDYFEYNNKEGLYRKGDPKYKRTLQKITPWWKNERLITDPEGSLNSFIFAIRRKV